METQFLYYAEMKIIIDSVGLKEGKTWGRSEVESEKKTRERENRTERKQSETDRGMETIIMAWASLTSACAYLCGLIVRGHPTHPVHPASSAVINLRFPTSAVRMDSFSSQMLLLDYYFLLSKILFRTSIGCLSLFLLLFLYFFLFKVFVVLIHYYEYCGNRVVLAGLNLFTI